MASGDGEARRGLDAYEIRARLIPAIAAIVPLLPVAVARFGLSGGWLTSLLGASVPLVVGVIAASLAREAGIRVQGRLWGRDRVSSVVELLRWRDALSRAEVEERHRTVVAATGSELPTFDDEEADPGEADGRYRVAETELRRIAATGDHPALTRAVTQYGLIRNFRGLRPVCLGAAAIAVVVGVVMAVVGDGSVVIGIAIAGFAIAYTAVVVALIGDEAVRGAGDTYARALLDVGSVGPPG